MGSPVLSPIGPRRPSEAARTAAPERPEPVRPPPRREPVVDAVEQAVQEVEQSQAQRRAQREAEIRAAQERRQAAEQLLAAAIRRTMIECQVQGVSTSEAIEHVTRVHEHFVGYL